MAAASSQQQVGHRRVDLGRLLHFVSGSVCQSISNNHCTAGFIHLRHCTLLLLTCCLTSIGALLPPKKGAKVKNSTYTRGALRWSCVSYFWGFGYLVEPQSGSCGCKLRNHMCSFFPSQQRLPNFSRKVCQMEINKLQPAGHPRGLIQGLYAAPDFQAHTGLQH